MNTTEARTSSLGFPDLTGATFGRLTVTGYSRSKPKRKSGGSAHLWMTVCTCGTKKEVIGNNLTVGHTRSCGCLHRELSRERQTTHGESPSGSNSSEFGVWISMLARCRNSNSKNFPRYGGRGIKVCGRWVESYENFLADMGRKPSPSHSIDRIDNNGNYEPSNCRWASRNEQARNTSRNRILTHQGRSKCAAEWAEITGLSRSTILRRLKLGWALADALETPLKCGPHAKQ